MMWGISQHLWELCSTIWVWSYFTSIALWNKPPCHLIKSTSGSRSLWLSHMCTSQGLENAQISHGATGMQQEVWEWAWACKRTNTQERCGKESHLGLLADGLIHPYQPESCSQALWPGTATLVTSVTTAGHITRSLLLPIHFNLLCKEKSDELLWWAGLKGYHPNYLLWLDRSSSATLFCEIIQASKQTNLLMTAYGGVG